MHRGGCGGAGGVCRRRGLGTGRRVPGGGPGAKVARSRASVGGGEIGEGRTREARGGPDRGEDPAHRGSERPRGKAQDLVLLSNKEALSTLEHRGVLESSGRHGGGPVARRRR
ncbi:hypothetical protein NDU88_003479 [Pleurodeles waltl]|uniref:Uncharacterized protein n=1 Tax=Pleurodeles waltl TaxID=8319 RepID=A0AAV7TRD4_PLEWA|nr:hypothetical protein NDU88_003479 [Pleurodeles waltl]